nr:hypothetical protein CFP56_69036 [Quercus suber]
MARPMMFEIARSDLAYLNVSNEANITNVTHLASYNWIDATTPSIAVPGCPPVWSAIKLPKKVKKDSGHSYIDQNAARHPESPLEPLFRALYVEKPSFDIRTIDFVSDRNNIRKLLSFVDPTTSRNGVESFTIKAEAVKDTVLLCRNDAKVEELIGPNDFKGFGHEFEKTYTTNQVAGSTGHHRIISFRFGDLRLLVRYEADGYVRHTDISDDEPVQNDMLGLMKNLSLGSDIEDSGGTTGTKVTIRKAGRRVSLASILEIKTRVAHKLLSFDEVASQLWVSQTPNLVRAYHDRGIFSVPVVEDIRAAVKDWEKKKQKTLLVLVALLQKISEVIKKHGSVLIRYYSDEDKLTISRADATAKMLPKDLHLKWTDPKCDNDEACNATQLSTEKCDSKAPVITSSETAVLIGHDRYSIPLPKFPYLQAFVEAKIAAIGSEAEFKHEPIPVFDAAFKGVMTGYRKCFRLLDIDVSLFQQLCNTYAFLKVDVLEGQSLDDISRNIKAGKTDFESETKGNKRLARDSAFRLVYYMLCPSFLDQGQESDKLYNAVLYVISHPGTFKYETRNAVRAVYDSRLQYSVKQRARLDERRKSSR